MVLPAELPEQEETVILQQKLVAGQTFFEVKTEQQSERKSIPMPNLNRLDYKGMLRKVKGIKEEG